MFQVGDTIIHPSYGPGTIRAIEKITCLGGPKPYYQIELLAEQDTDIWLPVEAADEVGLRRPVSEAKITRIWQALLNTPQQLPSDYKKRNEIIQDRFQSGNLIEISRVIRDLAWQRRNKGYLSQSGKRLYDKVIRHLAGEIATVQDRSPAVVQTQISERLNASFDGQPPPAS